MFQADTFIRMMEENNRQRYFVELSYDGSAYHGWQIQANAASVQETLEKAFSVLLKENISLTGCGRTDAGVHASYFVAHFDLEHPKRIETDTLVYKVNAILPEDIAVHTIREVANDMHARFSASYREYVYRIMKNKPIFDRSFCYYFFGHLDRKKMNEACDILMQYSDFTSFSKLHSDVKTNTCKVIKALWEEHEDGFEFTIRADRFLRNMVRSIVGTMMDIGTGKMTLEEFRSVIEAKDRGKAGTSAPAKALFLVDVGYDEA